MAEKVQAILDRMVPALKDLLDKEIFTESEIKAIVARRRESEYLLCRRSPRKSDFLRYIEAEKNLEKLRSLRNKKLLARKAAQERELRKSVNDGKGVTKPKSSSSIGDASIVQHIHLLYVRAKRKWKDDLSFHIQHAEFAKEKKSYAMLSKIYAEALQIHPRNAGLWIEAASHEYFGYVTGDDQETVRGGSIRNARVLLQRGLRVNQNSQELWIQSFCLELHYIQKLKGRREVLKVTNQKSTSKGVDEDSGDDDDDENDLDSYLEDAKLPRIVYKNAIKAIPDDVSFRVKFIEQCKLFPETQVIIDEIMHSIEGDFGNVEEAWISRARIAVDIAKNTGSAIGFLKASERGDVDTRKRKRDESTNSKFEPLDILEDATDCLRTPKMFLETITFTRWYINLILEQEADNDDISAEMKHNIAAAGLFLKRIIEKARVHQIISPELCMESASVLLQLGHSSDALEYFEQLMKQNEECRCNAQCWLKYADMKAEVEERPMNYCNVLRQALQVLSLHSHGYKMLMTKLFLGLISLSTTGTTASHDQELSSLYDKLLLIHHQHENEDDGEIVTLPSLCTVYMNYAATKNDAALSRNIYHKIIYNSNYTLNGKKSTEEISDMKTLFQQSIALEKSDVGTKPEMRRRMFIRLFDSAVDFFNRNGCDGIANDFINMKNKTLSALSFQTS